MSSTFRIWLASIQHTCLMRREGASIARPMNSFVLFVVFVVASLRSGLA